MILFEGQIWVGIQIRVRVQVQVQFRVRVTILVRVGVKDGDGEGGLWTNQVAWKKEGCRPFDKAAESLEPSQEPEKKR